MTNIWAIADLHLSFGVKNKSMDLFGPKWLNHSEKIQKNWEERISANDVVLIAGDISWAMSLEEAMADLDWLDRLPGKKVLIKGNHDFWWPSLAKLNSLHFSSLNFVYNNACQLGDISVAGTRLWDTKEYNYNPFIQFVPLKEKSKKTEQEIEKMIKENEKIFNKELTRLEISLSQLNPSASLKIAMTHYPPIGAHLLNSQASSLIEKYGVTLCVFGHLHNIKEKLPLLKKGEVTYFLTACDYLDFCPIKIG
ncbi:MAG: metallophosphoesterase [Rhabdochlamydiaceae bacterium]